MVKIRLRTKLLFSLILTTAMLTGTSLLIVQSYVGKHARRDIYEQIDNSLRTFEHFAEQRQKMLAQSAAMAANLPNVKALMTTHHEATIQDASRDFPEMAKADLFVLADPGGKVMALHTTKAGSSRADIQTALWRTLSEQESRAWWYAAGRLYEVYVQPIYFGSPDQHVLLGVLATGMEVDERLAATVASVASSHVAFRYGRTVIGSTLQPGQQNDLAAQPLQRGGISRMHESRLGDENFIGTTVDLAPAGIEPVTLTVLKSYDAATLFIQNMNRLLLGVGIIAVLAGSCLIFVISDTVTKPLNKLVSGVRALEKGDFVYPLSARSRDELGELTVVFDRMRTSLQESQRHLLHADRLATIGRMASSISHDLRHPLAAVLAHAEILSEGNINVDEREDMYQEIRLAVNRMTDLIASLLEFSKAEGAIHLNEGDLAETLKRSIARIRLHPEFRNIQISFEHQPRIVGSFDFRKLERAFQNILQNACESAPGGPVDVAVRAFCKDGNVEITVSDNGTGIPPHIREEVFLPFVTFGKASGTGLGLAVVRKVVTDHGGDVKIESTDSTGTTFKMILPLARFHDPRPVVVSPLN
jgi:signal transduction histidine kinase